MPAGARFCIKCGTPAQNVVQHPSSPVQVQKPAPMPKIKFSFATANVCKFCGSGYESARRSNVYYLLRWLISGALVILANYLILVLSALLAFETDNYDAVESLNFILIPRMISIPLAVIHLTALYQYIANALGITKNPCPVCKNTGEMQFYSRLLAKNPVKKNFISVAALKLLKVFRKKNIFFIFGIILAMLAVVPLMQSVDFGFLDETEPTPFLNVATYYMPSLVFLGIGLILNTFGCQINTMPVIRMKNIPIIFTLCGLVCNFIAVVSLTKVEIAEKLSDMSRLGIEVTPDMINVPMTGIKIAIMVINVLMLLCMYMSYKTEQVSHLRKKRSPDNNKNHK